MDTEFAPGAYRAVALDEETGNTILGIVELTDDGHLKPLVVEEDCDEALNDFVNFLNSKDSLSIEAAPPADAEPHEVYSEEVTRNEARFRPALADYLQKYYGIMLQPVPLDLLPAGVGPQTDYRDDPYRPLPPAVLQRTPDLAPPVQPEPQESLG